MSAEYEKEFLRAAFSDGQRQRTSALVAHRAIQEGVFGVDIDEIAKTSQEAYEKKIGIETTRERLLECVNGAFIKSIFRSIHSSSDPVRRIGALTACFDDPLVWNEHRSRTLFVVPPAGNEFGRSIVQETNRRKRKKSPNGTKVVQRPIPIWIISQQLTDENGNFDCYAISPSAGSQEVDETKNHQAHSSSLDLLHIVSPTALKRQVAEPTALEAREAFNLENRTFSFQQRLTSKDAALYPQVVALEAVDGISEVDMRSHQINQILFEFAGAYGLSEEIADEKIEKYFAARKAAIEWDGNTSLKSTYDQFDQFTDDYHTYDHLLTVLGYDRNGYRNWRGNERRRGNLK